MEKEFVNYEQALALKELGFDGKCLGAFDKKYKLAITTSEYWDVSSLYRLNDYFGKNTYKCLAPLYQQAFKWFRNKYKLQCYPMLDTENIYWCLFSDGIGSGFLMKDGDYGYDSEDHLEFKTYEEAELECLKKLIEIVKQK